MRYWSKGWFLVSLSGCLYRQPISVGPIYSRRADCTQFGQQERLQWIACSMEHINLWIFAVSFWITSEKIIQWICLNESCYLLNRIYSVIIKEKTFLNIKVFACHELNNGSHNPTYKIGIKL